jgi:hypothetical protein
MFGDQLVLVCLALLLRSALVHSIDVLAVALLLVLLALDRCTASSQRASHPTHTRETINALPIG